MCLQILAMTSLSSFRPNPPLSTAPPSALHLHGYAACTFPVSTNKRRWLAGFSAGNSFSRGCCGCPLLQPSCGGSRFPPISFPFSTRFYRHFAPPSYFAHTTLGWEYQPKSGGCIGWCWRVKSCINSNRLASAMKPGSFNLSPVARQFVTFNFSSRPKPTPSSPPPSLTRHRHRTDQYQSYRLANRGKP